MRSLLLLRQPDAFTGAGIDDRDGGAVRVGYQAHARGARGIERAQRSADRVRDRQPGIAAEPPAREADARVAFGAALIRLAPLLPDDLARAGGGEIVRLGALQG